MCGAGPAAEQPPPIDDHGLLDVGDGNRMYWEATGNPAGRPVLIVHGGPGSGRSRNAHKSFDHNVFRIVVFDQRGCGDSVPSAADPTTDMARNTTEHLLADMEALRRQLLRNAHRLSGIPGFLIHGRLDLSAPLLTAWELAQAWPEAELTVIEDSGHTGSPAMGAAIAAAVARFTSRTGH